MEEDLLLESEESFLVVEPRAGFLEGVFELSPSAPRFRVFDRPLLGPADLPPDALPPGSAGSSPSGPPVPPPPGPPDPLAIVPTPVSCSDNRLYRALASRSSSQPSCVRFIARSITADKIPPRVVLGSRQYRVWEYSG